MNIGKDLVDLAVKHIGERYVFGAFAPKDNAAYRGPWDCAELASWLTYQLTGKLIGCAPGGNPARADAYTGYWKRDAQNGTCTVISLDVAAQTPGAFLLRYPATGLTGHIAASRGDGTTVEAYSSALGVVSRAISGRRWDCAVLVPGLKFEPLKAKQSYTGNSSLIYRYVTPMMKATAIKDIQRRLIGKGFKPGTPDGYYGPQTYKAVLAFQITNGLNADGEAGPITTAALFN